MPNIVEVYTRDGLGFPHGLELDNFPSDLKLNGAKSLLKLKKIFELILFRGSFDQGVERLVVLDEIIQNHLEGLSSSIKSKLYEAQTLGEGYLNGVKSDQKVDLRKGIYAVVQDIAKQLDDSFLLALDYYRANNYGRSHTLH